MTDVELTAAQVQALLEEQEAGDKFDSVYAVYQKWWLDEEELTDGEVALTEQFPDIFPEYDDSGEWLSTRFLTIPGSGLSEQKGRR